MPPASDQKTATALPASGGVLNVAKPTGWTSHDVVAVCRGALGSPKVGHGGTLDPLATGVLPILVGPATRFASRLHEAPKVYAATVGFGSETATDDREGQVTRHAAVPAVDRSALDAALAPFRGRISQRPPAYAAVKVGGTPAYRRARRGEAVELAEREVTVERLDIAAWAPPRLRLLVVCSSGTYVRALARDIGRALASAAHLAALSRLAVGALALEDALPVERVRAEPDEARARLREASDALLVLDERFRQEPADRLAGAGEDPDL